MKLLLNFYLILSSYLVFTQSKDSVIFIPLGTSQINTSTINGEIKTVQSGMFHINILMTNGTLINKKDPRAIGLDIPKIETKVAAIATGDIHSILLFEDQTIAQYFTTPAFGMFYPYKLENIRQVASGANMSIALNEKNIMYTWGPNNLVKKLSIPIKTYGVKVASVGKNHVAFINIKDRVFVWGDHSKGQNNIPKFSSLPVEIASGDNHSIVRDQLGNVYTWGNNDRGQCEQPKEVDKAKLVLAKGNLSAIVYNNDQINVWGYHNNLHYDFKALGTVKTASLGNDFLVVVLSLHDTNHSPMSIASSNLKANWMADTLAKDSIQFDMQDTLSPSNFFENVAHHNFKQNSLKVFSQNSQFNNKNNSTELVFEGEGNQVTVINENMTFNSSNTHQRVIFKGSNNNVVIRQSNSTINNSNIEKEVIIDLDAYNSSEPTTVDGETVYIAKTTSQTGKYSAEYIETIPVDGASYDDFFIEMDSLPNSYISEWPIYDDNFYYINDEPIAEATNKIDLNENVTFFLNSFAKAQLYFYLGQKENGLITLRNSIREGIDETGCSLTLFEIYYYGLFGEKVDLTKAQIYYKQYLTFNSVWD